MTDFTQSGAVPVTIWSGDKFGCFLSMRDIMGAVGSWNFNAWGTANLAVFSPFFLPFRYPVQNLFAFNGTTAAGNFDMGIYNKDFALLASSGSTLMAGTSAPQFVAKDLVLDPGQYYYGLASNSASSNYLCQVFGTATRHRYMGVLQQLTAFPLPNPATPAIIAQTFIPAQGITMLSGTPSF